MKEEERCERKGWEIVLGNSLGKGREEGESWFV